MPDRAHDQAPGAAPAGGLSESAAAPARSPAAVVLALQRSHGNAAVGRMIAAGRPMLARNGPDGGVAEQLPGGVPARERIEVVAPRPGDVDDMDRAIRQHFHNEDWEGAARVLNGFNQADIDRRIEGYLVGERAQLRDAAHVNGGAAARIQRPAEFENAIDRRRWDDAARAIDGYPDQSRVEPRLSRVGAWDLAFVLDSAQRLGLAVTPTVAAVGTARSATLAGFVAGAASTHSNDAAVVLLNALTDEHLTREIGLRTAAQLFDIKAAADARGTARISTALSQQPSAGVIQAEGLDRTLRTQLGASDWPGAAATLQTYGTDDERRQRLQWLHLEQANDLAAHLHTAGPPALFRLVEARRVEKLGQEYEAALTGGNWRRAVELLNAYNDADLLDKTREIRRLRGSYGLTQCATAAAAIWHDDNYRVRRMIAYLPLEAQANQAGGPTGTSTTMTPGTAAGPAVAVPGGSVTAYPNAQDGSGTTGWFGLDYQGTDAARTGWLQFLTREAEKFDASGNSLGFETATVTHASGQAEPRRWGTPSAPQWTVDTMGGAAPFYPSPTTAAVQGQPAGAGGAHTVSASRSAMWDLPAPNPTVLNACFAAPAAGQPATARVVMRFKFHDYLVRGPEVLYENTVTVAYTATSAAAVTGPVNTAGAGATASRISTPHYQALIRRFPEWTYLPHG